MAKKMLELKKNNYVAIVDNNRLVEIEATSNDEAIEIYKRFHGLWKDSFSVCRVPDCITVLAR